MPFSPGLSCTCCNSRLCDVCIGEYAADELCVNSDLDFQATLSGVVANPDFYMPPLINPCANEEAACEDVPCKCSEFNKTVPMFYRYGLGEGCQSFWNIWDSNDFDPYATTALDGYCKLEGMCCCWKAGFSMECDYLDYFGYPATRSTGAIWTVGFRFIKRYTGCGTPGEDWWLGAGVILGPTVLGGLPGPYYYQLLDLGYRKKIDCNSFRYVPLLFNDLQIVPGSGTTTTGYCVPDSIMIERV